VVLPVQVTTLVRTARRNPVSGPDAMMTRIGRGIELSQHGERAAARQLFAQVWSDIGGESGDPLHRCALAHSMADVQDDVHEELLWDLRALEAADLITDERATQAGVASPVAGFYPSLHLNLGECYRKLGELDRAREHLKLGQDSVTALGDDGYGLMIKGGLDRLSERLTSV
jgi:hypothetical protein